MAPTQEPRAEFLPTNGLPMFALPASMGRCGSWSQASHAELVEGLAPRFLLHRLSAALLNDLDVILTDSNDCTAVRQTVSAERGDDTSCGLQL